MSLEVGQTADRGDRFPAVGRTAQPGAADADGPLVGDAAGLRASWHRIQAEFVDDPRESVADAAALVEHAAQVLVGTLRQRQEQLRGMWDTTAARDAAGARTTDAAMTDPAPTGRMPVADGTRATDETRATDGTRTADSGVVADSGAPADGVRATDAAAAADGARAADTAGIDSARAADAGGGQASGFPQVPDPRAGGYPGARARGGAVGASRAAAGGVVPDTEQLRLLMRRYRSLLQQICPPQ